MLINGQKVELLTAFEIFDNFIITGGDYLDIVFDPIEKEFREDAEYPFILESIKGEIKPDEKLKGYIDLLQEADLKGLVESAFRKIVSTIPLRSKKETSLGWSSQFA